MVLGDSIGEMVAYFTAADVAFVGGSLVPLGGQNLIEPISLGQPTLVGPHMFNFAEATEKALAAGAAVEVADVQALVATVTALLEDAPRRRAMHDAALSLPRRASRRRGPAHGVARAAARRGDRRQEQRGGGAVSPSAGD